MTTEEQNIAKTYQVSTTFQYAVSAILVGTLLEEKESLNPVLASLSGVILVSGAGLAGFCQIIEEKRCKIIMGALLILLFASIACLAGILVSVSPAIKGGGIVGLFLLCIILRASIYESRKRRHGQR